RARTEGPGQARRLTELMPVVIGHIGTDEVFENPVFGALLAKVDAAVADDDLGVDEPAAVRAQRAGGAKESVIAQLHAANSLKKNCATVRFLGRLATMSGSEGDRRRRRKLRMPYWRGRKMP